MIKVTGITDLISVKTLTQAANKIANSARAFARTKRAGKNAAGIKLGTAHVTKQTVTIDIIFDTKRSPWLPAYEWGSGIHATRKNAGKYTISAFNTPNLVFEGTNEWQGQIIQVPGVQHPGVKPRPFLEPAKRKHREEIKRMFAEEVGRNMRLVVKGMARKV